MINQYDNSLYASMFSWVQWKILQYGQAYVTTTSPLYYTPDSRLPPGYVGYSSPFKSWVYDSGVSGAAIIQSVSGGGFSSPLTRASGIQIDYVNGRVLVPAALGTTLSLTGTYSFCEVNTYAPNETEDFILTQSRFYLNPYFGGGAVSGIPPWVYCTPAVFVNTLHDQTDAFEFGGLRDCTTSYSLSIYAQTSFQLNALLSIFRDAKYQYIPMMRVNLDPINQWGDTYSGFNYVNIINQYGTPGNLIYIKDVHTSKVSDRVKMNPAYFVGLIDLEVSFIRQPPT